MIKDKYYLVQLQDATKENGESPTPESASSESHVLRGVAPLCNPGINLNETDMLLPDQNCSRDS